MPRFKQIGEIQKLMQSKEFVRNFGIIAHIDHGKTTLADTLLAGAGLLSSKMAGSARVLDYLEEEQRRKITIKTASISLLYSVAGKGFVFNLIDTPGHVDFTGKVTRALRVTDGAVVVVDAVEGIMAQTETLLRQALEERVRPLLFINKIDRLITELKLGSQQIEKRLNHIVNGFNDLIELYGESPFKERWKVDVSQDSVAFGSALHGWGFTLSLIKSKSLNFLDIINAYKKDHSASLPKKLPIYEAVFNMVVKHVPNPKEAQKYRIQKIWKGNPESEIGRSMIDCSNSGPTVIGVTKVHANEYGAIAFGRLFSGTVKTGDSLYMVNSQAEALVKEVAVNMGSFREPVGQVSAGNLASLTIYGAVKAGETLVNSAYAQDAVPFEKTAQLAEAVVTVAVEPKNPKDLPVLLESMDELAAEDPSLTVAVNQETGEYMLSGIGELHLDISLKELQKKLATLEIKASIPRVVYRETVMEKGVAATASSPNRRNRFTVQVEPIEETAMPLNMQMYPNALAINENRNILVTSLPKKDIDPDVLEFIIAGFEYACGAGPICGEPVRGVKANLTGIRLSENVELHNSIEVMHGVGKALFGSFLTAKPVLLEPVYKTVISSPAEFAGECLRILNSKRGKVLAYEQKGVLTIITSNIPVAETFGLSQELRSVTSGRAFWQSTLDHWDQLPEKLASQVTSELRKRKGLPREIPAAVRFLEDERS